MTLAAEVDGLAHSHDCSEVDGVAHSHDCQCALRQPTIAHSHDC